MHGPQDLTACVEFATGGVMLIGYKRATAAEAAGRSGGYSSYIVVVLRRERCRADSLLLWEHIIPGYYPAKGWHGGVGFHVALRKWDSPAQKLRHVIQALQDEGYLDRGQELRAYIGLGISYP